MLHHRLVSTAQNVLKYWSLVVGVLRIRDPAPAAMEHEGLHRVGRLPLRPLLLEVVEHNLFDHLRRLIRHDPDGKFSGDFFWNHRLGSGFAECTLKCRVKDLDQDDLTGQGSCAKGSSFGNVNLILS